jgi:DNA-binding transcriptional ArsR family regulator
MAGPDALKDLKRSRCNQCLIADSSDLSFAFPLGNAGIFITGMDAFERLLWWLFAGSTGAETRFHVLGTIKEQPRNAQQISQILELDYTTVRHHLRVLEQNRLVVTEGDKYGKLYFLSDAMEGSWEKLEEIVARTQKGAARKSPTQGDGTGSTKDENKKQNGTK